MQERAGDLGYVLQEGLDATASVTFRLPGDDKVVDVVLPVSYMLLLAAQGATIEQVSAPDQESWTWTAAARVVADRAVPAGLILPEPVRRRRLWTVAARDDRGLSAALVSQDTSISERGQLGKVLAAQVARTTVEGARRRLARVQSQLDRDSFQSVVAGSVAEYFASPAALAGSDGAPALLVWEIASFDPLIRSWHTLASFPPVTPSAPASKRRGALSSRALKALEAEVFGAGFSSPRAVHSVVSLDAPVTNGEPQGTPTLGDQLVGEDPSGSVEAHLELGELAARARLSPREREVLQLRVDDQTEAEIAAVLGLSRTTVNTFLNRAMKKLIVARRDSSGDV